MVSNSSIIYSDFNTGFISNPVTGDVILVINENSIKQAIKNLIYTRLYEVPFEPNLGSSVMSALFEDMSPVSLALLVRYIKEVINNYEPIRVTLIDVTATPGSSSDPNNQNSVSVQIVFYCNVSPATQVLNIPLSRVL